MHNDFVQGSDYSSIVLEDLVGSASEMFKLARSKLDQILTLLDCNYAPLNDYSTALHTPIQKQEALCLVKVCIGNNLFLHQLLTDRMKLKNECSITVYFDFTIHKQLCVLKLIKAKSKE